MELTRTYRSPWLDEELDDVRQLARTFFEKESVPNQERWAKEHQVDREYWNAAGDAGLLCIAIPTEFGGGGGTFAHEAVVMEEQAAAGDDAFGYSVHSTIVAPYIMKYGTQEQKEKWLPKLATGELVGAIAMTEPGAGSDLQALRTSARLDGDEYVVNGSKTFITNGTHADLIIVVVRTGEEEGGKGLSLLVIETDGLAGFERGRVLEKLGMPGQDTRELFFSDMRVPKENILGGEEGQAFLQLMEQLPQERLIIAVAAAKGAELAIDRTVEYAKERQAFGRELMKFQNTRFVLAECATQARAVRTLVDHCIELHLKGELDAQSASMAKWFSTDQQCQIIDRCLQIFGGYGYMLEYPIARAYAAARVQKIYGGTNEIMKELIARTL
ncbi:acyl-CoA dehydrogenase [Barrientosiimonas humi]|uniref:Acyl-[acyl-carrier-protein] dehydrogenase MbtN n=1 Tax=Barrientosiimonas humi TaxID=999931 RepID=A0A542X8K9_9MICO|nr:acyl-CoA dehydrogenase family protein [Barrientosiimonas humi]TQL32140.1 acyl-CoA dehydrogenase [Barrientosiimonas humi]CAG7572128.1 Acyl-CoA dehydrogenase [Barrientosiimonas humi]